MTYRRTGRYNEDVPTLEAEIAKLRAVVARILGLICAIAAFTGRLDNIRWWGGP